MRSLALICLTAAVSANGVHDINGNILPNLAPEELIVASSGKLGDRPLTIEAYASKDVKTRGEPPYVPPANRQYNTGAGPVEGKINVHLVPHTHDDTGWQVTVDQYFAKEVYYVVDTVVERLLEDKNRRFMYVETGFFARWWDQQNDAKRNATRTLVQEGRLEFINGGWCMHDEASPYYTAMVDQTTRGHQFLKKNFGPAGRPRGTWQIDPFGHSNTEAWLLGAAAGMESLFWGRTDYQDERLRKEQSRLEWIWQGSESNPEQVVFAGELYGSGGGGYSTWMNFDGNGDQVNDDPTLHDYNADQWVDKFVQDAQEQANNTRTSHQLWACGTDFQYQDAVHWYRNLDKLIHYVNQNGTVNAFYSTPSFYVDQKKKADLTWELRQDDIWPLADNAHNYWTGYFTSRPALKRQVRFATNTLNAARQMEILAGVTAADVDAPVQHPAPPVGDSWTDSLEGSIGVATHHDGMSGTERQDVSDDYSQRISESGTQVEAGIAKSLQKLLGTDAPLDHCNCNAQGNCLNISVCAATTGADSFTVAAWNLQSRAQTSTVRVPVTLPKGQAWAVTDADGKAVDSQVIPLDGRTLSLPLLYINKAVDKDPAAAHKKYANDATHVLVFDTAVAAVGYATFYAKRANAASDVARHAAAVTPAEPVAASATYENDVWSVAFDADSGLISSVTNKQSGVSTPLKIEWGWYNSSVGGCTEELAGPPATETKCSGQKSGAYIFRPNSSELFYPGATQKPTLEVVQGELVTELRQTFSSWATHVVRLVKGKPYLEVEWTAGPIPVDTPWMAPVAKGQPNNWGKELVVKYSSGLQSGSTFYTDANGREMVKRVVDKRGPSYPEPYNISEPVAGNYYPINAMIAIEDEAKKQQLAVLTDVTQGGASLKSGEIELMVHRRVQADDSRGVQEPLNETMCGCNDIGAQPGSMGAHGHEGDGGCECEGLTMRGRHWLVLDTVEGANEARRQLIEDLNYPPTLAFAAGQKVAKKFSAVAAEMPANVKLLTITNNYAAANDGAFLLRLAHLYSVGEHPTLSQPATVSLAKVFANAGLKIVSATETMLTGDRPVTPAFAWKTKPDNERVAAQLAEGAAKRAASNCTAPAAAFDPSDPSLTVTLKPMELKTFMAKFE
eukprot:g5737.t1